MNHRRADNTCDLVIVASFVLCVLLCLLSWN
jgi:hypothetical protein